MNDTADIVERFQSPLRKNTIFTNLLYRVRLVPINTGAVLSWSMPYESVGHSIPVRSTYSRVYHFNPSTSQFTCTNLILCRFLLPTVAFRKSWNRTIRNVLSTRMTTKRSFHILCPSLRPYPRYACRTSNIPVNATPFGGSKLYI